MGTCTRTTLILPLLCAVLCACERPAPGPAQTGRPEASLHGNILPSGEIAVEIAIPDGHHAYLDSGREGNLIPVSFVWDLPAGAPPKVKLAPIGEKDAESGASVLRGSGRWVFTPAAKNATGSVKIRSQICDEIKGICFPPRTERLELNPPA